MLYESFQAYEDASHPTRVLAAATHGAIGNEWPEMLIHHGVRKLSAAYELVALAGFSHQRPAFGIDHATVGGAEVAVREEVVRERPFGSLLRFRKDACTAQPRVLLVAPLSGHFATLLRGTVRTLLPEHDVYITDWHNPRDVPLSAGRFGFDEYVLQLIDFLEAVGPGAHLIAVCQPTVAALAAVALMAEDKHAATPLSMTLMAGPIDTRVNPTRVNELATSQPIEWFEANLIARVPMRYAGGGRRVYPGFLQLGAFMRMNLVRHVDAFLDMFHCRARGDHAKAEATRKFYDEYFAIMDLPAEFYLETVKLVFQQHALAKGELRVHGRRIEPKAIRRTALLTVEGERDDICSVGQTLAAQDLCGGVRPYMKLHHVQPGVGHYGVFSGKKWEASIYPRVRELIHMSEAALGR
jgi:polyhydroxyalkanoate depolymerase